MTASVLHDEYELPPEAVWTTMLKRRYDRVTLHPDDQRYELREPARVAHGGPFPLIYEDLIAELRDALSEDQEGPVPVFPFGYDWRMPLFQTEKRLASFVCEVIDRTLLLRHYRNSSYPDNPNVSLIGHSMGGLIIAGYIQRCHEEGFVREREGTSKAFSVNKVVTLASPFRGSHEAILKVVTGTANFGDDSGKARERRMARITPSLYHLLPSFAGAVTAEEGTNMDIFDSSAWQPSVVRTIEQQVAGWNVAGNALFQRMLAAGKQHRKRISDLELREPGDEDSKTGFVGEDDWLAVIGVDSETRVGLTVKEDENNQRRFVLSSAERRNEWDPKKQGNRRHTGDGTVPLEGAVPPFLNESRLVCVTPDDFGYWELRDRGLSKLAGFHALIPKMNMLHRLVARFLLDKGDPHGSTWGRRVPGVAKWDPPFGHLREKDPPEPSG